MKNILVTINNNEVFKIEAPKDLNLHNINVMCYSFMVDTGLIGEESNITNISIDF